ncbi:tyrosine-protein kinase Etk/Wzc [Paraburkholderia sp. GAS199]|uniref:polysaccharide biosynthesis tyrosine autokinase n=1 Tax=Paraburkholderia sp. GAS199 TaxID=3035126 RepID=UPI003D1D68CD
MQTNTNQNDGRQIDEIDLRQLYGSLVDNRWLILGVTSVIFMLSAIYAFFAAPIYQSDVMVQVEQHSPLFGTSQAQVSQLLGTSTSADTTEIALLTSRLVVGKAVADLHMAIDASPHTFPLIGSAIARRFTPTEGQPVAKALFGLRSYAWGGERIKVSKFDVPETELNVRYSLTASTPNTFELKNSDGVPLLSGNVGQLVSGNGISIQVDEMRAATGTRFDLTRRLDVNAIQRLQNDLVTLEQGKDSGIISLSYQSEDPAFANAVLREISEAYVTQNIERSAAEAEKSLQFVNQQLPKVRADLDKAQSKLSKYQASASTVDLSLETKALLDQIVALDSSIEELKLKQTEAGGRFQDGFPALRTLDDQVSQLTARKAALRKQIGALPDTQQELLQLTRDVQVSTQTYTALLAQAQQLDVARAGTVGSVRVVDTPSVDTTNPVKPKRLLVLVGGLLGGFVIACLIVFVRQMVSRGIEDPAEIESLGLTVCASIPMSKFSADTKAGRLRGASGSMLVALDSPADLAVEALRSLRTSLYFAGAGSGNNRFLITGLSADVGKTFVSCNLGAVMAQAGQRVLVVDADMRRGTGHELMGIAAADGLAELIAGRIDTRKAIRKGLGHENLDFIPRGRVPVNPSELLMSPRFIQFLDEMSEAYEMVIVDSPPILSVTDSSIIGNHVGTTLMVVRFGENTGRELQLGAQRLDAAGVQVRGVIFNAIEQRVAGFLDYKHYEYGNDK